MSKFGTAIGPAVEEELRQARTASGAGNAEVAFAHLERAHVLGQASTVWHVRVHCHMFVWGWRQRQGKECLGQVFRIFGAATMTGLGWVPHGNTGGSNVSPFRSMAVPADLAEQIASAQAVGK